MKPPAARSLAARSPAAGCPTGRRLALLSPLLLVAACAFGQHRAVQRLDQRLQARLTPDIAAGDVALQRLPDGARVTLLRPSRFPNSVDTLDDRQRDTRAGVIEGLLDPSLMRIQVADTSALPDYERQTRVNDVTQYIVDNGLGETLQPAPPLRTPPPGSVGTTPAGLTITISVHCPHRHDWPGYGSGRSKPACD